MMDPVHDPGPAAARARAEALATARVPILRVPGGGEIRIGTAGWTDPALTAAGVFYPPDATTPDARLRHYASVFPLVEVDSPYYALPSRDVVLRWVERTPDDFVWNVKAYALMTGHPAEPKRLPAALRAGLPAALRERPRVYAADLPPAFVDDVWRWFADAIAPLAEARRLGAVLLQYPRWFRPARESADELLRARDRLGGLPVAIEFRHRAWYEGRVGARTLEFLAEHDLPLVLVDGPQGLESSVPPIVAVTSPRLVVLRLHGRRVETWERAGVGVAEKYRYLYDADQLAEWARKVVETARRARVVHVIQNNCHANYGTTNALEFGQAVGALLSTIDGSRPAEESRSDGNGDAGHSTRSPRYLT